MRKPILGIALTADFYPGLRKNENTKAYDGNSIEWTFSLSRKSEVKAGVYEIRFVRTLAEEEALGYPVLGG